jgi:HPt (histidine-containing phosphotransfer) domain-containing protein
LFLADLASVTANVETDLKAGRTEAALAALHTIKGTAGTVAADRVAAAARALEAQLKVDPCWQADTTELAASIAEVVSGAAAFTAPAAVSSSPCDSGAARRALPIVDRLAGHLADNNLEATTTFEELRGVLAGALAGPLQELGESIDRLDYAEAGRRLALIRATLAEAGS